ncbi:MAG: 2-C-methyl-D-erythritol 4-phosphate cytidylyltransferase [Gammaproteobacteria bacterium]
MSTRITGIDSARCWVVVPAAGVGRRMRSEIPKQYLPLADRTVLAHSLARMATHPAVAEIVVVLAEGDPYWHHQTLDKVRCPVRTVTGGKERSDSVLNGLQALADRARDNDWAVPREQLWHALTPQMFRYRQLRDALRLASEQGLAVTDEAMAMERTGQLPCLVEGHSDNIKITRPEDLALAAYYLNAQDEQGLNLYDDDMLDGG